MGVTVVTKRKAKSFIIIAHTSFSFSSDGVSRCHESDILSGVFGASACCGQGELLHFKNLPAYSFKDVEILFFGCCSSTSLLGS